MQAAGAHVSRVDREVGVTNRQLVLFTDLDGTLLDHDTYEWTAATTALEALNQNKVPWVLVTSKTGAEVATLRESLNHTHPYIVENGQVTVVPDGYFPRYTHCASVAIDRTTIINTLQKLRVEKGFRFRSFSSMGSEEIARETGLPLAQAHAANDRVASEPVQWADSRQRYEEFVLCLRERGLVCSEGGRFIQVTGPGDKGEAVARLFDAFQTCFYAGNASSVALGDAPNDLPMLNQADLAVVIRSRLEPLALADADKPVYRTQLTGPAGWNEAVWQLIRGWPQQLEGE